MRAALAAGACLSEDLIILLGSASRAELDSALHAGLDLLNEGANIQVALYLRLERGNFFLCTGVLQPVQRAAIGYRTH